MIVEELAQAPLQDDEEFIYLALASGQKSNVPREQATCLTAPGQSAPQTWASAASPLVCLRVEPQRAFPTGHHLAANADGRAGKCDNRLDHLRDALPFDFFG